MSIAKAALAQITEGAVVGSKLARTDIMAAA